MLPFFLTLLPFQLCWPSPSFSYPFCEVSSGFITGRQEVNAATCLLSVPNPTINRQRLCKEVTWLAAAAAAVVSYSIVSAAWTEVLAKNFIVCSSSQLRSVVREIGVVGELVLFNWTMVAEICACGESGKWGLPVTQKKVELRLNESLVSFDEIEGTGLLWLFDLPALECLKHLRGNVKLMLLSTAPILAGTSVDTISRTNPL